jgi:aspartate/methionine/tyrosine aminotransferase
MAEVFMKQLNSGLTALPTTIFTQMSALSREHNSINLGQGFPDTEGPADMIEAACSALHSGNNQYAPLTGLPELRTAVAENNARFYGLDINPDKEVIVTSGATEALAASLAALLNPGDEIIVLEPAYDTYLPFIRLLGAIPKLVRLSLPDWSLPRDSLKQAFSSETKAILLNSPMNPNGKVFTAEELAFIASLVKEYDAYAICDEVYEHLTFGHRHIPLMTLPDMRDRCIRIGSAGKSFSFTGWKVGYITASEHLTPTIAKAHQNLAFSTAPALQHAVACGLQKDNAYFKTLAADMQLRRDILVNGLTEIGFKALPCDSTYFVTADISALTDEDDLSFCLRMTVEAGVTLIPVSAFYDPSSGPAPNHYVRFAFCKQPALLEEALHRLRVWLRPEA